MEVEFLEKFDNDLDLISQASVKNSILKFIEHFEKAKSIREIPSVKKLSGHKTAYRIRIGNYRLGLFAEGSKVQFARLVHRKDIYKVFP